MVQFVFTIQKPRNIPAQIFVLKGEQQDAVVC
jgi:hypothetical protein